MYLRGPSWSLSLPEHSLVPDERKVTYGSISLVGDEEDRSKAIDIDKFFSEGEEPYVLEVQSFEEIED